MLPLTRALFSYYVTFGEGDGTGDMNWEINLDGEKEERYLRAKMLRLPLDGNPDLEDILDYAYGIIEEYEVQENLSWGDEYTLECEGRVPVDPEDINERVAERDQHTLEFFNLTNLSDEELNNWDANNLETLPNICDFEEDFEPETPYDEGWSLSVEFAERPDEEDLEEAEARETLKTLFKEANGDFSVINDYVERCEHLFKGDKSLKELSEIVADEINS